MGWLDRIVDDLRGFKKPTLEEGAENLFRNTPIICRSSYTVSFEFSTPDVNAPGIVLWGVSGVWTSGKGGSGFEIGVSQNKVRLCDPTGRRLNDVLYSLPPSKHQLYTYILSFEEHSVGVYVAPLHKPSHNVRLRLWVDVPLEFTLGLGAPPALGEAVSGASFDNFRVQRIGNYPA